MENSPILNPEPEAAVDYSLLGGEHLARGRRLFLSGLVALIVAMLYLGWTAHVETPLHVLQGMVILVLSVLPSLLWARSGGSRFPAFEVIMLLCANSYAIPLLNAREQLAIYSEEVVTRAGWTVITYTLAANLAYRITGGHFGTRPFWRESLITHELEKLIVYGMTLSTGYIGLSTFAPTFIPRDLEGILRAVFYGIGILCTFISSQRWGRGEMKQGEKGMFVCMLVLQVVFMSVGLLLISSIGLIGIALMGYLSGGKRIPWLVMLATFATLAVLHSGKAKMREKYWDERATAPTILQLPGYFSEWFQYGLMPSEENKTASRKLLERTSLMHMLCLIIDNSPGRQDYLYGSTYRHVLPQLVPRFFWPDKPRSHIATYELAIYYGLQSEEATASTTIAFGMLTEAYANFGVLGAVLLGIFWGVILKKLQIWSSLSPMFSFAGLFMILITAWSFNAELTMAAWVSSFQQAAFVVLGVPLIIRGLFGL